MTDEQTIARLRASETDPGAFLDALESLEETQEMLAPSPESLAFIEMRESRDVWRFACVASWMLLALTFLTLWENS